MAESPATSSARIASVALTIAVLLSSIALTMNCSAEICVGSAPSCAWTYWKVAWKAVFEALNGHCHGNLYQTSLSVTHAG